MHFASSSSGSLYIILHAWIKIAWAAAVAKEHSAVQSVTHWNSRDLICPDAVAGAAAHPTQMESVRS